MIEIHTTCKDKKEAEKISKKLLDKKLAVCVNYFPVNSMYKWKGKTEKTNEYLMLIKTNNKNEKKAFLEIKKNHSYSLPVITSEKIKTTKQTEDWIKENVS